MHFGFYIQNYFTKKVLRCNQCVLVPEYSDQWKCVMSYQNKGPNTSKTISKGKSFKCDKCGFDSESGDHLKLHI